MNRSIEKRIEEYNKQGLSGKIKACDDIRADELMSIHKMALKKYGHTTDAMLKAILDAFKFGYMTGAIATRREADHQRQTSACKKKVSQV